MLEPGSLQHLVKDSINYAPPKDAAGNTIKPKLLSRTDIFPVHPYVDIEKFERDPNRKRSEVEAYKQKLSDQLAFNPDAAPEDIEAGRQIIDRLDALLATTPPDVLPTPEVKGRNDFEKALIAWNFPKKYEKYLTRYAFPTPAEVEEGKQVKKSFIFTRVFTEIINKIDWSTPTLRDPKAALNFASQTQLNSEQLLNTIDDSVSREDATIAAAFKKDMLATLGVLGEMIDLFSQIKAPVEKMRAQQLGDRMQSIYTGMITFGNIDRLQIFDGLPPLMDLDGNLSAESVGKIFFEGVKEALFRGHDWVIDPATGWYRERQYQWTPGVPTKRGKNWVITSTTPGGAKVPTTLYSPMYKGINFHDPGRPGLPSTTAGKSLFPEDEAGKDSNNKVATFQDLREYCARFDGTGLSAMSGNIAGTLAYQLLVNWGEADAEDMVFDPGRGRGAPVGWSYLARVENSGLYAQKTAEIGAVDSKTNPFIVGRMQRAGVPYNKYFATEDGKTLEQAILTSRSWGEVFDRMQRVTTERASLAWSIHMVRAFVEYGLAESILEGDMFNIATINFQEGQVRIKPEIMKKLFDRIRNALEYHEATDLVASGIFADPKRDVLNAFSAPQGSQQFIERKLPSEEFYEILVVDPNFHADPARLIADPNNIDYESHVVGGDKGRYVTRFPGHYYTTPVRLGAWLQDPQKDAEREEESRAYDNAIAFNRPVLKLNPTTGRYERTGQIDHVILVQIKDSNVARYKNDAKSLVQRLHVEYILEMAGLPSDVIPKLKKEDWLPLGMFFSEDIRRNYQRGKYGKWSDDARGALNEWILHISGGQWNFEFIAREDSGILGRDLFSESQFFELLDRLGFRITAEDWTNTANLFGALVGLPKVTTPSKSAKSS